MVFYYEQNQPMYFALLVFARTKTIFGMVARRFEFWFFLLVHCAGVVLFRLGILGVGEFAKFRWEAVSATQMFMVFCLTFFNGHCFTRYLYLYDLCMEALDGTLFFVQELVVSMSSPRVEQHRIRAVKYVIAMMHIFFVGITGGMKSKNEWREIVKRGLLSKLEAEQLQSYPTHCIETVLVLSTWAMQIIDKALEDDVFWDFRSMRIAHTHNRLQAHMNIILKSVHEIGDVLALPIPYPYYHVMNLVLIFNLLILCVICASFQTYQTVFPFFVSLMFFLGLREVSASLADPFNGEDSDFPIENFLQYVFDNAICMLESFRGGNAEEFASRLLDTTKEFTEKNLRHKMPNSVLYQRNYDPSVSSPFSWNKEMPLLSMAAHSKGPLHVLKNTTMAPTHEMQEEIRNRKEAHRIDLGAAKRGADELMHQVFSCKDCCIRCCNIVCPRRNANVHLKDEDALPPDVLRAQHALQEAKDDSVVLKDKITECKFRLKTQKQMLEHRVEAGKKLGLPIDKLLGRNQVIEEVPERLVPEFKTFDEARILIRSATRNSGLREDEEPNEDLFARQESGLSNWQSQQGSSGSNLGRSSSNLGRQETTDWKAQAKQFGRHQFGSTKVWQNTLH